MTKTLDLDALAKQFKEVADTLGIDRSYAEAIAENCTNNVPDGNKILQRAGEILGEAYSAGTAEQKAVIENSTLLDGARYNNSLPLYQAALTACERKR